MQEGIISKIRTLIFIGKAKSLLRMAGKMVKGMPQSEGITLTDGDKKFTVLIKPITEEAVKKEVQKMQTLKGYQ